MKKQTEKRFIILRYILPPVLILLILAAMLLPAYRFVVNGEVNKGVSAWDLISNSFEQSRQNLFGTETVKNADMAFSRAVFWAIVVSVVLYLLAFAVSIWSLAVSMRYFFGSDEKRAEKSRTVFTAFFPNRVVLTAVQGLALFLPLFPYLMSPLYKSIYSMRVVLVLTLPDGLILASVCILAIAVLSCVACGFERRLNADVFTKDESGETKKNESYTEQI